MRKRLTEKHPTYRKVQEAFDALDRIGVRFEFTDHQVVVLDTETNGRFLLNDIEDNVGSNITSVGEVPPVFDWKLNDRSD